MPVVSIAVGPQRVPLTAAGPAAALGRLAGDYVLARAAELLIGTPEAEMRKWLMERYPDTEALFRLIDAG